MRSHARPGRAAPGRAADVAAAVVVHAFAMCALAAGLGACKPSAGGVRVGEAPPVGLPPAPGRYAEGDTVYVDSAGADAGGTPTDSALASAGEAAADSVPDFDAFWAEFQAAVRSGRRGAVAALAVVGPGGIGPGAWPEAADAAFTGPFREAVLALAPRDVAREGPARTAVATVGYDAGGAVVPEDEAETDASVVLRFEVVGNAWRLVRIDRAG